MKTTFKFIIAAMAAIAVSASCQKELVGEISNNTDEGFRVISVQFDNSTKATLNGLVPSFENGDLIRVSTDTKSEVCTLDVSETTKFTTTLSGALTAIYPADAAVLSSDGEKPIVSPYFNVSASQDGTIAKAIIAKADISAQSSSATFNVQTALFQITPPSGVTTFTITSLKTVASGARTGTAKAINTDGQTDKAKCVITVSNSDSTTFYVALKAGVKLSDLSFEYTTDATHGAMKGITKNAITAASGTDLTAANTKYTINEENWHPYVKIGGKKWATENIGATDTDPYGTYFSWGSVEKVYSLSNTTFTFQTDKPDATRYTGTWTPESGFAACNTPYYNGSSYSKYTISKSVLELADDAAYANWGGPWRMPTGGTESNADFTALAKAADSYTSGTLWYTDKITSGGAPSTQGVYYYNVSGETVGVYFVDANGNMLFFPAAGYGDGANFVFITTNGSGYWSSSLNTGKIDEAYDLCIYGGYCEPQYKRGRYIGFAVRPVSD